LAKENLTTEEVNKLCLATDNEGSKVFHVAANSWILEVLQGILNWDLKNPTTEEVNKLLLLTYLLHGAESFLRSSLVCS